MTQEEYEHKKRECWIDLALDAANMNKVTIEEYKRIFNGVFDKAYALGMEKDTITQEDVEKAAEKYATQKTEQYIPESYGDMRFRRIAERFDSYDIQQAFEDGANFALGKQETKQETKQEKDADTVIQGWVCRNKEGDIFLYKHEPNRIYDGEYSRWEEDVVCTQPLPRELFPDLTWKSEPQEVEINIKRKKK